MFLMGFNTIQHGRLYAQPYLGGEIIWECHSNGNYRFVLTLYRDCHMVSMPASVPINTTVPGLSTISLSRTILQDLSPACGCPGVSPISCSMPYVAGGQNGAVQRNVYTSDNSYPNGVPLTGTPPAAGWSFYYVSGMRPATSNISYVGAAFAYVAKMYPYQNTPVNSCFDNAPVFNEAPSPIFCAGQYAYVYHGATDIDGDSLRYEWSPALSNLNAPFQASAYVYGYSSSSPFPGTIHHQGNIPALLDHQSGLISFLSRISGSYTHSVTVSSFRNGIKTAEVTREFVTVLTQCDTSNTPPFININQVNMPSHPAIIIDTVDVGQLVQFNVQGMDFQYCPNVSPPLPQGLNLNVFGAQFGGAVNPAGCLNPPCAVLSPSPSPSGPLTGQFGVNTAFSWQPECQHLYWNGGDGTKPVAYDFIFKAWDNFCPIPAMRYATLRIVVRPLPMVESPAIRCVSVSPGGAVELTWDAAVDSLSVFNSYHLWHAHAPGGPYTLIDSLFNINTTQYVHQNAMADTVMGYYRVTTRSGCGGKVMSPVKNTIRTMLLHVAGSQTGTHGAHLSWNHPFGATLPGGSALYEIYRKNSGGSWSLLGTSVNTYFWDTALSCTGLYVYRVELMDTATTGSCRSVSNEVLILLADNISPASPVLHLVSVAPGTHQSILQWTPSSSADVAGYVVLGVQGGVSLLLDTVWGAGTSAYTDLVNNPCAGSIAYHVSALDQCGNVSTFSTPHQTLFLQVQKTIGINGFTLHWNPYLNMGVGVAITEILFSLNGASEVQLATLSPLASSYQHTGLSWGDSCCYRIRIADSQQLYQSHSCQVCQLLSTGVDDPGHHGFLLRQNIPNPAGESTRIPVFLARAGEVELVIHDPAGNKIMSEIYLLDKGETLITLSTKKWAAGIYFYTVHHAGMKLTRKMVVQQ